MSTSRTLSSLHWTGFRVSEPSSTLNLNPVDRGLGCEIDGVTHGLGPYTGVCLPGLEPNRWSSSSLWFVFLLCTKFNTVDTPSFFSLRRSSVNVPRGETSTRETESREQIYYLVTPVDYGPLEGRPCTVLRSEGKRSGVKGVEHITRPPFCLRHH